MHDDARNSHPGLLDRLIHAYQALLGRSDRPEIPPPPDPVEFGPDMSPPTPEEQARAEAAAREAMRRLRSDD